MKIPKSKILENQYTNGTGIGNNLTLRYAVSKIPYFGYYNIINGNRYYTGKTYTSSSKILEKYNIVQTVSSAIATAGSVATLKGSLNQIESIRYFYKDLTNSNILIKEIDKKAYDQLSGQNVMSYQVISYNPITQTLDEVNQQMPGLRAFLVA